MVDRNALNEAFNKFLSDEKLNINQIRFVNLIIDYIVENGNIEDKVYLCGMFISNEECLFIPNALELPAILYNAIM